MEINCVCGPVIQCIQKMMHYNNGYINNCSIGRCVNSSEDWFYFKYLIIEQFTNWTREQLALCCARELLTGSIKWQSCGRRIPESLGFSGLIILRLLLGLRTEPDDVFLKLYICTDIYIEKGGGNKDVWDQVGVAVRIFVTYKLQGLL